jgi:Flp pilus assembly protein TadG
MISLLRMLWKDTSGNVLVMAAAAMPILVGAAGFATDTIQWTLWKRQLQRAADSAAIAGVYTGIQSYNQTAVEAAVDTDLAINNHTLVDLTSVRDVDLLGDDGDQEDRVQVTLEVQKALTFSSFFRSSAPVIRATATAASIGGAAEYCVQATDTSASSVGIEIAGSATVDMGDCSLIAMSSNQTQAAQNTGNGSSVTAKSLAAVGGVQFSSSWNVDSYDPYSTAIADPFINLKVPTTAMCNKSFTPSNSQNANQFGGGSVNRATGTGTTGPGSGVKDNVNDIVCINSSAQGQGYKGVSIGSGTNVVLGPATYVINGGDLKMTGGSLSCNGCTIILTGPTAATIGGVKITGGNLSLVAPATNVNTGLHADYNYKGIALMQDRNAIDSNPSNPNNDIVGNGGQSVQGAVYIPNQALAYSGGSSTVSACVQIVSKRVKFTGNSLITATSQCAAFGLSPIGSGANTSRKIRLVA